MEDKSEKTRTFWPAARILLFFVCIILGVVTAMFMLADSNEFTKITIGMFVVCMSILFYWVFFMGIGRIVMWIWRKIRG